MESSDRKVCPISRPVQSVPPIDFSNRAIRKLPNSFRPEHEHQCLRRLRPLRIFLPVLLPLSSCRKRRANRPSRRCSSATRCPTARMLRDGGVQFSVYSKSATAMRVLLYRHVHDREPVKLIEFNPSTDRWGDIWSIFVPGLKPGQLYHFQADGPFDPAQGQRFNPQARLIDPYARAWPASFSRRKTASPARRSASSSTTRSIGKATAISAGHSPKRSSTKHTSAASPAARRAKSMSRARTPASSKRFRT